MRTHHPNALDRAHPLYGVGGWMLLFLLGQLVAIVMILASFSSATETFAEPAWSRVGQIPMYQAALVFENLFAVARLAGSAAGIVLTVRLDRRAPRFWVVYLLLYSVGAVLDAAAGLAIGSWVQEHLPNGAAVADAMGGGYANGIRGVARTLIWCLYWMNSQRVWITFGRGGWAAPSETPWRPPGAEVIPAQA